MPAQVEAIFGRNITMVYDILDPDMIDRNQLRTLISEITPTVMDMPDMIVAVYESLPLITQIGDRRIRVNYAEETPTIDNFSIGKYANQYHHLLNGSKATLIAYGFNYDFGVLLSDLTLDDMLITKFVANRTQLENILHGQLISFLPRISFKNEIGEFDILFEPFDGKRVKVHGNIHFQGDGIQLPDEHSLQQSFLENFERLQSIIIDLLN